MTAENKIRNPQLPLCTSKARFASMCLREDVSTLAEGVLYMSSVHNGLPYNFMFVRHKKRTVHAFQSRSLRGKDHALEYSVLKKVMDRLGFDNNPDYKLVCVYCSDWSSESEVGCVIINNGRVMASAADIELVDSQMTIRIALTVLRLSSRMNSNLMSW